MNEGDVLALVTFLAVVGVVVLALVLQAYGNRRRLEVVRAAIEANQPEVAQSLLAAGKSNLLVRALVIAAVATCLILAGAYRPGEFGGLFLLGSIMLAAAVPLFIYAGLTRLNEGQQSTAGGCGAAVLALVCTGVVVVGVMFGAFYLLSRNDGRMEQHLTSGENDFRMRVRGLTGSPVGTVHPVIGGQRAEPVLTGASYAMQTCGSPFHDQIRFRTLKPGYLNVYYLPNTAEYLVIGEARVEPAGVVVMDGRISAKDALRAQTSGARAP